LHDVQVGTVVELWRYPVKSLPGERLTEPVRIGPAGVPGDRLRAVEDPATGKILSAKTVPALLSADRDWDDERLSEHLGRPVRLIGRDPDRSFVFDMDVDEADPAAGTVELRTQPGSFYDGRSTLHLVSRQSIGDWDVRRFRPNLLVDVTTGDDHPEDAWVGRRLRIGDSLEATVRKQTGRCVITTRAQPGVERDLDVLRSLNRTRQGNLGVYLDPQTEGAVAPGDAVELLDG
jgi:uncharacterized protein YcbX